MIVKTIQDALNAQINDEQYAAQLYLAMSVALESRNFKGFAKWLRIQSAEETSHAMRLIDFVLERGGRVELKALQAPPVEFGGPLQVFEGALKHEQLVTSKIHALYEAARSAKDYATEVMLHWFISEQVEEEASAGEIVERIKAVGDQGGAIWYLDKELGKRSES